jgi:hypothetical protein
MGVTSLKLPFPFCDVVDITNCVHMSKLILHRAFRGQITICRAISLKYVTIGALDNDHCIEPGRPDEVRLLTARGSVPNVQTAAFSSAPIIGEVAAANRRPGGPALPC